MASIISSVSLMKPMESMRILGVYFLTSNFKSPYPRLKSRAIKPRWVDSALSPRAGTISSSLQLMFDPETLRDRDAIIIH